MNAIGIDVGTSFARMAYWSKDHVHVLDDPLTGESHLACHVAFTETGVLIGYTAQRTDPTNCIHGTRRLLGRRFSDVQHQLTSYGFTTVATQDDRPVYRVSYMHQTKLCSPEEITALVLKRLKETASARMGRRVTEAVMTVPVEFGYAQRKATVDAATIAGLKVLRLMNEPTAALVAYGLYTASQQPVHVLVYDLGGSSLSVTLLTLDKSSLKIIASETSHKLGGVQFDQAFVQVIVDDLRKKHNITVHTKQRHDISKQCHAVKEMLSIAASADVIVEGVLPNGQLYKREFTSARFGRIIDPLVDDTLATVTSVLAKASLQASNVHHVVLVGGSCRLPHVANRLAELFGKTKIKSNIRPDHVIAQGAATMAAIVTNSVKPLNPVHVNILSTTIGVESNGGLFTAILPRNTPIPCQKSIVFTTRTAMQTRVTFPIREGEDRLAANCQLLGTLDIDGIPPRPAGQERVQVKFIVDERGMLHVEAQSISTRIQQRVTIAGSATLSPQQLKQITTLFH